MTRTVEIIGSHHRDDLFDGRRVRRQAKALMERHAAPVKARKGCGDGRRPTRLARERPSEAGLLTATRPREDFDQLALGCGARGFVPKDNLSAAEVDRLLGWIAGRARRVTLDDQRRDT
jgi:hypothetical protein